MSAVWLFARWPSLCTLYFVRCMTVSCAVLRSSVELLLSPKKLAKREKNPSDMDAWSRVKQRRKVSLRSKEIQNRIDMDLSFFTM